MMSRRTTAPIKATNIAPAIPDNGAPYPIWL